MRLSINEIAAFCGGKLVLKDGMNADTEVSSVVIDSRKAEAGGAFLATVGERVDGHRFISGVFQKGACLAEPGKARSLWRRRLGKTAPAGEAMCWSRIRCRR